MLKKTLISGIVISLFGSSIFANDGKPAELVNLPHPVKVIMPNLEKLKITKKQEQKLNQEMLGVYPKVIQGHMKKIAKLEKKIQGEVLKKNKTKTELSSMLDTLQKMKRDATDIHIDALNVLAGILNKEQMEQSFAMMNKKNKKSNKFRIDELVLLPHPGKFVKTGKIVLTKEQKQRLNQDVKKTIVPKFQEKMREAFEFEKKLQRAVAKGIAKDQLKDLISKIVTLKTEALDVRLDALYGIKNIVTQEQWEKINKLTYK